MRTGEELCSPAPHQFFSALPDCPPPSLLRLQFEARNQKKEAKEMAVIEAMKRREQEDTAQPANL